MHEAATAHASLCLRWRLLLVAGVLFALTSAAIALPTHHGTAYFTAISARDTLFTLPVKWVTLDSVRLYRNGEPISEFADWRLADPGNRLWLYRPLGPGDTLRADFAYQPIPLFRSYARRSLHSMTRMSSAAVGRDSTRLVELPTTESSLGEGWSRLNKSGSLIRSVQIGTGQDLQLESSLNLQIQGRVGRNVDVVAALTDQSTPIQPEGTTEALSELEKVFISVRTPRLAATIGDYTLDLAGGQYDSYSRKLSGILGEFNSPVLKATGSGAVSRGQFFHYSFQGQEANQGPYALPGRNGEIGIVILAGTEKVWLDGALLRRGEGNDYVINYGSGEISFTSRRMITSDSRIAVDYEYASEDYERFYGASRVAGTTLDQRFGAAATYITESDDRTRPINLGLNDADKARLVAAGDNPDSAVIFSADSIGINGGDYIRRDTLFENTHISIFQFMERDSSQHLRGHWQVAFDDFGIGHGDYVAAADSLGATYFRWVGPSLGRYRPYRRLPLPKRQDLMDVRAFATPLEGLTLRTEAAASRRDLNTFSSLDDANDNGYAFSGSAEFSKENWNLFGLKPHRLELTANVRHRDANFSELSRVAEIEFEREWFAAQNSGNAETVRETNARFSPISQVTLAGGYGDLSRPNITASRRRSIGLNAAVGGWNLNASHLALQNEDYGSGLRGSWIRQASRLNGSIGRFRPRLGFDREHREDHYTRYANGFQYLDYQSGLGLSLPANLNFDGEYRRRDDDLLSSTGKFFKSAKAQTITSELLWAPAEGGSSSARFTHREKDFTSPDSANAVSDVGRLESLFASRNRLFESNLIYEAAKTRSQNQILIAVEVPAGTGSYRREGNHYVPDDQGNFILVPRFVGTYAPATELTLNALFWLRPDEMAGDKTHEWYQVLSSETEVVMEERTRRSLSARLLLLDQSQYRGDSTLYGSLALREDVHVWRLSQKFALRLRYRYNQTQQNQYLNGGQYNTVREEALRVRARYLSFWRGETEGTYSTETLHYAARTVPDRDIRRFFVTQNNVLTLSNRWEVGADLRAEETRDERTATQVSIREARPHAALTVTSRGRLDGDFTWTHATSNKIAIPYELGRGANRGENLRWSLRGTYQFGQSFSGSLSYSARKDAGEKIFHTGRLDVRASF